MNIALPILLLVFGGLTFWVLTESALKWYFKVVCISVFCLFTIIFWSSIGSFLGWPALENDMPEKVVIHWVVIKEPNKHIKSNGRIYVLLESIKEEESSFLARFFGYRKDKIEPRLYGLIGPILKTKGKEASLKSRGGTSTNCCLQKYTQNPKDNYGKQRLQ